MHFSCEHASKCAALTAIQTISDYKQRGPAVVQDIPGYYPAPYNGEMKTGDETGGGGSEEFYTLEEVIQTLKVSRTTLWRWRNEPGLRMVRIHGVVRVRKSDLHSFLDRGAE